MKKEVTGGDMCVREEETQREKAREKERLQKYTESRVQTCQRVNEPERVKR